MTEFQRQRLLLLHDYLEIPDDRTLCIGDMVIHENGAMTISLLGSNDYTINKQGQIFDQKGETVDV